MAGLLYTLLSQRLRRNVMAFLLTVESSRTNPSMLSDTQCVVGRVSVLILKSQKRKQSLWEIK